MVVKVPRGCRIKKERLWITGTSPASVAGPGARPNTALY
jgi:hypothetical protein